MANYKRIQPTVRTAHRFDLKRSAACVKLAIAGGLVVGSLSPVQAELPAPMPHADWAGGHATTQVIGNHMHIDQRADRAILNWQSFNIGKENSVHFQQPSSTSIALNKIYQNDPSRILGALTANGQVYLVNRNGFVFGRDSRVDVRGLVASTLDVSDEVLNQGITKVFTNNQSAAFRDNAFVLRDRNGNPVLDGSGQPITALLAKDANGNPMRASITLEEGAQVKSGAGDRILIIAPTITNKGSIQSDDGQAILAASTDSVFLQEASGDSDVRGLLVEVQTGGEVNNLGTIASRRGNVTLIGFAVNQRGKVSATTSVNLNGSIRLLARENAEAVEIPGRVGLHLRATSATRGAGLGASATVTLGEHSRTEVTPELGAGATAIDEQVQPLSKIAAMGHRIHIRRGAEVVAPGGVIDAVATESPTNPLLMAPRNDSRILIESGARIDVSGIDTTVKPIESNIIEVELRLNQLKDSPLQRDGILFGKTILVDIRKGTPLADIQPNIAAIQRTLGERLARGGKIKLGSEGDIIVKPNAVLDISGGRVTYLDGFMATTKLTSNGRIFDISEAHPSLKYDGIHGEVVRVDEKWGVRKVWKVDGPFSLARREAGYIEGHAAGRLTMRSPNLLFGGELKAGTVSGRWQRTLASKAHGGQLIIDMRSASAAVHVQSVIFSSARDTTGVDPGLGDPFPVTDSNLTVALALQADLLHGSRVQDTSILTDGAVEVAANSSVKLADGGSLTLQGGRIDVNGHIKGAGADVALNAQALGGLDGSININRGARIALQGGWVNDRATPFASIDTMPVAIGGGHFSARANGDVNLSAGSLIDVSGGAWRKTGGEIEAGAAGGVRLAAGVRLADELTARPSNIVLDGRLNAYALNNGGSLELTANAVAIRRKREEEAGGTRPLQIQEDFFGQGGFAHYSITANINGLVVDEGVQITLRQVNRLLTGAAITRTNTDSIEAISRLAVLPAIQRAPSSLALMSDQSINRDLDRNAHLVVNRNAAISADPLSRVTLHSDASLYFDGAITARGGAVALAIVPWQGLVPTQDPMFRPDQGIWLGDNARIDVSGVAVTTVDALRRRSGEVHDGGSVTLDAQRGFVATKAGSRIDASGTVGVLHLARIDPNGFGLSFDPVAIGSHGGSISISAAEGLFAAGSLSAWGGDAPGASGGRLSIRLDSTRRVPPHLEPGAARPENLPFPTLPGILTISQQPEPLFTAQFNRAGDAMPVGLSRQAYLAAGQVEQGGFASLDLQVKGEIRTDGGNKIVHADGEIRFLGDVDLTLRRALTLDAPKYDWRPLTANDSGRVTLHAVQASLGSSVIRTALADPANGAGRWVVNADLIELRGGSHTTGFNRVDFNARSDIRLRGIRTVITDRDFVGEFRTFGALNLTAGQVYTTTLSQFGLIVTGEPNGTVRIDGHGGHHDRPALSTHSQLTVRAPNIEQRGVVKAPFGEIVFAAPNTIEFGSNSVTSVSGKGLIVPFGVIEGGLEWLFPIGGQNLIIEAPNKTITIRADRIQRDAGASIDLAGGGDMLAFEFVPGVGGSRDVLATRESFAVMPGFSGYSPFDPNEFPASGLTVGDSVFLGAGSGLPAGYHTLMPARYALLPGAFLVTPQTGTRDMIPGTRRINLDGATVVAGYNAVRGATIRDQRWSGFAIEPGSIASTRSQLDLTHANSFFARQALRKGTATPRLPRDAGHLIFDAKTQLDLPVVRAEASNGGLAGLVDIVAGRLEVVNFKNGAADTVQLRVSDLGAFEIGSLLLGAVRSFDRDTGAVRLDVKSRTVALSEGVALEGQEVIVAASETVELKQGASIRADGKPVTASAPLLETTGDRALLRVSTGAQAITAANVTPGVRGGVRGDLIINDGARVSAAAGSVLLDSTRRLKMGGRLEAGASLSIGADAINLGEVAGRSLPGLSLDNAQLSGLQTQELALASRGNINLYGDLYRTDADGQSMPIRFNRLVFDAAGFAGFANAGKTAAIQADTITLRNTGNVSGVSGDGAGELSLGADQLRLERGNFRLSGFARAEFNLRRSLTGSGETTLTSLGDLRITAGYITGVTGSNTTLAANGHLSLSASPLAEIPAPPSLAARMRLSANRISIDAPVLLGTGHFTADASSGDVTLGAKGRIDVSGAVVGAGLSDPAHVPAGRIDLISRRNDVITEAGSKMWLYGHTAHMSAGALNISAIHGQARLGGAIDARAANSERGGRARIDVASLAEGSDFGAINRLFNESGFSGAIDMRLRNGDLTVAAQDSVNALNITLTADRGALTVSGALDATRRGDGLIERGGGAIELNSRDKLMLTSTASLNASAQGAGGDGGTVRLSSIDAGGIEMQGGAMIDVSANGGKEGHAHLRAARTGNGVNIEPIARGAIKGDSKITVEAVRVYDDGRIDAADIARIRTDTADFMQALNPRFGPGYEIAPGVEIRSAGDMTLAALWNFVEWRYGAEKTPGFLTLRAAGDVLLQSDLTDAFADVRDFVLAPTFLPIRNIDDMLQPGRSWSYAVVAGADLRSADSAALTQGQANSGDIRLANNVRVRTGTGTIGFHAGRDIVFANDRSVVYTAGRPDEADRFGLPPSLVWSNFYAEYPLDGGDITLTAGGDIRGAVTHQIVTDWLFRTGNWGRGARPTAWGLAIGRDRRRTDVRPDYRQNVGALGGGNISITAGGDIHDLSVVIPTTGKQVGRRVDPINPPNVVEIKGGGNLHVSAGGDVKGGMFYVDGVADRGTGRATIAAAGSLTAGSFQSMNPVLALGDARFHITAGRNIDIEAIIDPMTLPQAPSRRPDLENLFFRYGADSAVTFVALSGNVGLDNDERTLRGFLGHGRTGRNVLSFAGSAAQPIFVNPASLQAYALHGDIVLNDHMILFPSASGRFELFAARDVTTGGRGNAVNIAMSDTDWALLPSWRNPANDRYLDANSRLGHSGQGKPDLLFARIPNHIGNLNPALISTLNGNVTGRDPLLFVMAKPLEVMAGNDIRNVSFQIQHNVEGSQSILNAGRDVRFDIARNPDGSLKNVDQKIEVSGPGQLTVLAGRDVDLGVSNGISTVGNRVNPALAEDGANIDVIAGLAKTKLDVAALLASPFLTDGSAFLAAYRRDVTDYMRQLTGDGNLTEAEALEAFATLPSVERAHFNAPHVGWMTEIFNALVQEQGKKYSDAKASFDKLDPEDDKEERFEFKQAMDWAQFQFLALIETVFPGTTVLAGIKGEGGYSLDPVKGVVFHGGNDAGSILSAAFGKPRIKEQSGDISSIFSRIHTTDGGDINLYAPNGGVNAGLAVNASGARPASELGIVAVRKGAIHSIVRDDFQVNTTRVMTLGGGDIVIGATDGDIDAGRGAKTAFAAPPPIFRFDPKGNVIIEFPPAVAGSGVRASIAPDGAQGNVLLFALLGIIDAAEAGVGGKDVTVGATAIVGADNIDVGGVQIGLPPAPVGSIAAGLGNVGNVAAAVQQAVEGAADAGKDAADQMASAAALGIISVDIVGFGDEDVPE